jgi:fengycin family lipopeptide synthetase D
MEAVTGAIDKRAVISRDSREKDYWLEQLSGDWVKTNFPYDYNYLDGDIKKTTPDRINYQFDGECFERLMKLRNDVDINLHMIFVAGVAALLYKYTNRPDIIVGTPVLNQESEDKDNFINTILPLRHRIHPGITFKELLLHTRQVIVEATDNQNCPIETLFHQFNRPPGKNDRDNKDISFPLFDVVVLLGNIHDKSYIDYTRPDITFSFIRKEKCIEGMVEYKPDRFHSGSIGKVIKHFCDLMYTAVFNLESKVVDIEIGGDEEIRLLERLNDTARQYPFNKTIFQLIREQVQKTSSNEAVIDRENRLTYQELEDRSNPLAHYLNANPGIRPDEPVGIILDRSAHLITAILGILKAGAAYVPIEPSLPETRVKTIIDDSGIGYLVSEKKYIRRLNRLQWECSSLHSFLCLDSRDIYQEEEPEKNPLMDVELWHHVAETAVDEITAGGWFSSYTGEPFSKQEMEEYSQNILEKVKPLLDKNTRVLEIGCASGLSMFKIAPLVQLYYGTDMSQLIIEKNRQRVEKENISNIRLTCLAAHEIHRLDERDFDLIILNSVIQSFHGHNYLRRVMGQVISLVKEKGFIFVGDIMDQDKKQALVNELTQFKRQHKHLEKTYQIKTDWSAELFVSRSFFTDLSIEYPGIKHIDFSGKIYTIENELTKFRYDALLSIDKQDKTNKPGREREKSKHQHDAKTLELFPLTPLRREISPGNLAYIIYTSGSTGKPRGVMIQHRALVNYVCWAAETYVKDEKMNFPLYTSIAFDLTVTSIFVPLITGNRIIIYGEEESDKGELLRSIFTNPSIGIVKLTPAHLQLLTYCDIDNSLVPVKALIVGGEKLETGLARQVHDKFNGNTAIYNEYGPTEAAVGCMIYRYQPLKDRGSGVPIGIPSANVGIYLLDNRFRHVPVGVPGEIFIGGHGLARGYLNNPELTHEKFDQDLWDLHDYHDEERKVIIKVYNKKFLRGESRCFTGAVFSKSAPPGRRRQKLYQTGDLARRLPEGNIEFSGRIDFQVKIRGYRIEPGEIESRLKAIDFIRDAVVINRENDGGENELCAYLVMDRENTVDEPLDELRTQLSVHLPGYMIPSYFVWLERIPLTSNGKVDKKALPEPEIKRTDDTYAAPGNKIQETLVEIWSKILKVEKSVISIDGNFFELGGHSLRATIVIAEIHKVFDVKVPLTEIFRRPNIRELSEYIGGKELDRYYRIEAVEKKDYYVLSSAQKRLYILQQFDKESITYNEIKVFSLEGEFDIGKLESMFKQLIRRHQSLRTSFAIINNQPVQRVYDKVNFEIEYLDLKIDQVEVKVKVEKSEGTGGLAPLPEESHLSSVFRHLSSKFIRPFDLSRAPLFRVGLIKTAEKRCVLILDMHHIITDGTSMLLLVNESMVLYLGKGLPKLRLQYKDFSEWQHQLLNSGERKKQETFWLRQFQGEIPVLSLPVDYPRPSVHGFEGSRLSFEVGKMETDGIKALVLKENATLYMILLAIYTILLSRLSSQEDIIVGTVIAGRRHVNLQGIIGMFVNTLANRNYPTAEKSFITFFREVRDNTIKTFENQEYQFEDLVEKVAVERDVSRNPLFTAALGFHNMEIQPRAVPKVQVPELKVTPSDYKNIASKFDITLHGNEVNEKLLFTMEYSTRLFKEKTIVRFIDYFKRIVASILDNPRRRLFEIEILSQEEKKQLLLDFNDTAAAYSADKTIHELFEEQVQETPDHLGVIIGLSRQITYKELNEKAHRLACRLQEKGVVPDTIVGIMVERSIEMIIGILGILKAGGAYLPIDPDYPEDRINYMLTDSGAEILLTIPGISKEIKYKNGIVHVMDAINRVPTPPHLHLEPAPATCLAYIIYTSGSTGNPKGVLVEHQAVVNTLVCRKEEYNMAPANTALQLFSYVFDGFLTGFFTPIISGARVVLLNPEEVSYIKAVKNAIIRQRVTHFISVPAFYRAILEGFDSEVFDSLKVVTLAGDMVSSQLVELTKQKNNQMELSHEYGVTEAGVMSTIYRHQEKNNRISIGSPVRNTRIYIVDWCYFIQPVGIPGELCIGGAGLARGYLNQPELTAQKFDHDLWDSRDSRDERQEIPGKSIPWYDRSYRSYMSYIIYKTGDLARWRPDGNIEFLGRMDYQVKIRGFRIELEEIEYRLLEHEKIKEAVVLPIEQKGRDKYLNAYIVSTNELAPSELRKYLSVHLPDYMIPSYFIPIDAVPLTTIGKIDRKALTSISASLTPDERFLPPQNNLEKTIAAAWRKILQIDTIGIHNNYFDMGGNSINILTLSLELEKLLKRQIHIAKLFQYPTIASFARHLEMEKESESQITLTAEKQSADVKDRLKKRRNRDGSSRHHSYYNKEK